MAFTTFERRWFGAATSVIQSQSNQPDPETELKDRVEITLEDLNEFQSNVAVSFDSITDSFLTVGGNRTDANLDTLTDGSFADALHSHASMVGDLNALVINNTGATLTAGQLVAITASGVPANRPIGELADKDVLFPAFGMVKEDIPDGQAGPVVRVGLVTDVDTSGLSLRDVLYLGNSGQFTATEPTTGMVQVVGVAIAIHALAGTVFVDMDGPMPGPATAAPPDVAAVGAVGTSDRFAREDHTHGGRSTMLLWGNRGWGAGTSTRFADPYWSDNNAGSDAVAFRVPRAGVIRSLYFYATQAGSGEFTATVRVNGASTALAVTVGSGIAEAENLSDEVSVNAGDRIDLEITRTASGDPDFPTITAEFV